jgi:cytochrome c oxidase assembly protein subunit 15
VAAVAVPFSLRRREPQVEGVTPLHYEIHGDREGDRIIEPEPVA